MGESYGRHQGRVQAGNDPLPLTEQEPLLPGVSTLRALGAMYLIFIAPGMWSAPRLWRHARDSGAVLGG